MKKLCLILWKTDIIYIERGCPDPSKKKKKKIVVGINSFTFFICLKPFMPANTQENGTINCNLWFFRDPISTLFIVYNENRLFHMPTGDVSFGAFPMMEMKAKGNPLIGLPTPQKD